MRDRRRDHGQGRGAAPRRRPAPLARPARDAVNLPPGPAPIATDPTPDRRSRRARPTPTATPTPDPIPQDPKDAAPALDPGAATSVYDSTKFLYSGANPIQRDVEPGAIDAQAGRGAQGPRRRTAPARRSRASASPCSTTPSSARPTPAPTARSTSPSTAAASRSSSSSPASCPVQRTLAPDWQDYETLDDVVMVPVDPNVKTIDPDSTAPFQVVRGTRVQDKDGERQGTLLFPKGVERHDGARRRPRRAARGAQGPRHRVHLRRAGRRGDARLAARQQRLHVRRRVQRRRGAEGRRDPGQLRQAADQLHRELHRRARRQRRAHRLLRPREGGVGGRARTAASSRSSPRPAASPPSTPTATARPTPAPTSA